MRGSVWLGVLGLAVGGLPAWAQQLTPPRLRSAAELVLPAGYQDAEARAVKVRVTLDEQGQVQRAELVESGRPDLAYGALGAACSLDFEPARLDGEPTPVMLDYVFRVEAVTSALPADRAVTESAAANPAAPDPTLASDPAPLEHAAPAATVLGVVRDAITGKGVAEAEVYVVVEDGDAPTALTDATGHFELPSVPSGTRVVAVTATGFQQLSVQEALLPGETVSLDLTLQPVSRDNRFVALVRDVVVRRISARVGAITVVTEKDLHYAVPQNGNDIIRQVTGLHVRDEEGMGLRLNVGFRGLDPTRSRKTLILEDGLPVTLNPYSEPDAYYTPPIERMAGLTVEKGADTILQGPQTVGGVLNYLTADPPQTLTTRSEVRAGSYGYWMAHVMAGDTRGPVGWRADVSHRSFAGPRRLDLALLDMNLKLRFLVGSHTRVTLKLNAYDEFSRSTYLGLTTPQYEHNWQDNFAIHDAFELRRHAASLHLEQQPAAGVSLNAAAYAHRIERNWGRQNFDRFPRDIPYERQVPGTPGAPTRSDGSSIFFHEERIDRNRLYTVGGVQAQLTGKRRAGILTFQVITGGRLHVERAEESRLRARPVLSAGGEVVQQEERMGLGVSTWSQLRFSLWERLHFTPGVRLEGLATQRTITRALVPNGIGDLKPGAVNRKSTGQHAVVIPGVGLSLDLWDGGMVWAGVHRGWAPPRVKDSLVAIGQNIEVTSEESWNAEAGARMALGDWLTAEAAAFIMDFKREVVIPSEAGGAAVLVDNATGNPKAYSAPAQHRGFELAGTVDWGHLGRLPFSLATTLGYTFVDARFTGGAFEGYQVPYAPPHVLLYRARFDHPVGLYAQLAGNWVGPQYPDNDNTEETSLDGTLGRLDPYLTMDGTVGFRFRAVDVFASMKNIMDQRYIVSRAPRGIIPGNPRQALVGVRIEL